ncbi:MAG: DUF6624 domain-containing protein [Gluconobacter potus]|uniref:DUF4034 domain-containing protein n=1 Tax=Gluconobacter potus TaxID=2724927 RepID=A0ABR9YMH5_9PROT|nr:MULTISPECIES: DUF6624 domain-containing protein [Gluconobacter]MBF0864880.1 hypothetical protein [Gluconobacter sp. R71656]MBF0868035.1 hypothetical protein [Gluconobacter sp. R75628]MBF0874017.1 hypothetical protein [Gluconobacter sp. R75629]MBF0882994.1 hypothetical protein [Gluconobacter potus]
MARFRMLFLLAGLGVFSAAPAAPAPPVLAPFIHDGSFEPGDYGFVRGAFPGATAQQVADWKAIKAYGKACMQDAALIQDAELKKLGVAASVPEESGYQDHVCMQVNMADSVPDGMKSWEDFQRAMSRSLPYFQTYEIAVHDATKALESDPAKDTLEEQITAHVVPDQMWRFSAESREKIIGLDAPTRSALKSRLISAIINVDWGNSHWARHVLETQGWTSVLKAGHKPAKMLWTLVQHADVDPGFQVMALRQLEPLARSGQFPKQGYALLTDRVMLATTGKQHYGSQLSCQSHHYAPISLDAGGDNPKTLDARRADMNLPPEATYLTHFPPHC